MGGGGLHEGAAYTSEYGTLQHQIKLFFIFSDSNVADATKTIALRDCNEEWLREARFEKKQSWL